MSVCRGRDVKYEGDAGTTRSRVVSGRGRFEKSIAGAACVME